jgi:hypothetical protein
MAATTIRYLARSPRASSHPFLKVFKLGSSNNPV